MLFNHGIKTYMYYYLIRLFLYLYITKKLNINWENKNYILIFYYNNLIISCVDNVILILKKSWKERKGQVYINAANFFTQRTI